MIQEIPVGQGEPPIVQDDQWSDNPLRRKAFWLDSATTRVNEYITQVTSELQSFPVECGAAFHTGGEETWLLRAAETVPISVRDEAVAAFDEVRAIIDEKGFRFRSALNTAREHMELGSSGYGGIYKEADPDIPIPLLRDRLVAEGRIDPSDEYDSEILSFEEVDRARRLIGMTILDPLTQRVTDEVDAEAAKDSYHFLSPIRREEVIRREAELIAIISSLVGRAISEQEGVREVLPNLALYCEAKLTTPELNKLLTEIMRRTAGDNPFNLDDVIRKLKVYAVSMGYWDHILTPQEILMRVGGNVDEAYLAQPYTPLGIKYGESIDDIARLREGEGTVIVNNAVLEFDMPYALTLETLSVDGSTIKSPTFLDPVDEETAIENEGFMNTFKGRINVPFAREEDWYYQGS